MTTSVLSVQFSLTSTTKIIGWTLGRWGTTDVFTTSFLRFSPFSTAVWDLANSRSVHSLVLSSRFFFCPSCLLPPFTVPCRMALARRDERETCPYHFSLHLFTMVRRSSYACHELRIVKTTYRTHLLCTLLRCHVWRWFSVGCPH